MVKYSASEADSTLDLTFQALADPTRRAILGRLAEGEATAGELAAPFEMSLPAVSKHLKVLEKAGFLIRARDGRVHRCNLDAGPMQAASDWISTYRNFWEGQLGSLARYLETEQKKKKEEDKKNEPSSND
ncbi:MAG: winged helix-turn-helix transcriptional regulator [Alphaproteobacteria bacterium]|jgi:DNA-binding transcriptional ArsR family regulator|nr:winged helix-turn-helix transcriptional regulator [Alphaproteobacteria bacterium]MBT4020472.1 winged helix-turn-helix transcriptional regulator [Alphaproteobacteria bacterium]MBT4964981.1 winged helix-turn-helix transcriptional regulator [Alphaproteobacteria bacterium]MBT5161242.1 winged helix-turn-helix transcriptional regulator [Alphaproteobacteria bacterium]MBT5918178.1 winged helix-turn-helix transcriptional regulator [Alphaproteobacteria bacterium]